MPGNLLKGEFTLAGDGTLNLLQITDTHLMAETGGRLLNVDADASLDAVLAVARRQQPAANAILVTGDISGDASANAYDRLANKLAGFPAPSFWLPGNHDGCGEANIAPTFFTRFLLSPHWLIAMLNSQVDSQVGGHLAPVELDALARAVDIANGTGRHLLVALHHPLWPLGCTWLDPQRVGNAEAFATEIHRCRQRKVVLSGHVHQASDTLVDDVRYLTTPSTCVQFAPGAEDFQVDICGPGYRWLSLHPDGHVDTGVERVTDQVFPVDLDSGGYL